MTMGKRAKGRLATQIALGLVSVGLAASACRQGAFDNPYDPESPAGLIVGLGGPPLPTLVFSALPTGLTEGGTFAISFSLPAAEEERELSVRATSSDTTSILVDGAASASVTFAKGEVGPKSFTLTGAPDHAGNDANEKFSAKDDQGMVTFSTPGYSNTVLSLSVLDFANIYTSQTSFTVGTGPEWVFPGDFDGDGKTDLVVVYRVAIFDYRVASLRNTTTTAGSFSFVHTDHGFISNPAEVFAVTGDLNFDGKPDLAITDDNNVILWRNTSTSGTIAFTAQTVLSGSAAIRGLAVGDLDGDGKNELALSRSSGVTILLNNTGTAGAAISFTIGTNMAGAYSIGSSATTTQIVLSDLNADSKLDILVGHVDTYISTHVNASTAGSLSFMAAQNHSNVGNMDTVAAGDLDGDGKPDIVGANTNQAISVFRNTTAALATTLSFAPRVDLTAENEANYIELIDLNANGKLDMVITDDNHLVSTFQNTSTVGTISYVGRHDIELQSMNFPERSGVADLDADGKPDLVLPSGLSNHVRVFRNLSR